jgi:class 3 adenylate cyclase/tetratricopeptide (TPR) repeat protein
MCGACGSPLPPAQDASANRIVPSAPVHPGERRQVTALFCDLIDSVPLTLRLDPEDMMQVVNVYLAACDRIVAAHGGHIVQYMGDGVLAYFGYPHAHEDSAANAVLAGLGLRDAVGRLDLPPGIKLQLRVGIATGLVVIGDLAPGGDGHRAAIVGETPNLAARLQSIAQPDTVVVARTTQRITRGLFSYRTLGTPTLKGFAAPMEAFEAVEAAAMANRFGARAQGGATPLVGREQELVRILGCWEGARRGTGRVVLLQGEPGIGKSRLLEKLRQHAFDTPHAQLTWYCGPTDTDSALRPVTRQLARAAGFARGDSATARREKLGRLLAQYGMTEPRIQDILGDLLGIQAGLEAPGEAMTAEKRKEVTLETLLGLVERRAGAQPALIVLEDAHWSDSTTLDLLTRAIGRAVDRPWLILVTARPEFAAPWLGQTHVAHVELGRLNRGDAERICDYIGAAAQLPAAVVRQIVQRSDGNPLFVEEMTKSVLEAAAHDDTQHVTIPASLQDSLVARLDRLGPARRIANLGAAIGRRFGYGLLAAVAGQSEAELRQGLLYLTQSGLVEGSGRPPESFYFFKHALIRDAAYDSLLKRERQALHGQIAAALRDRFGETRDTEPELLAYHLTESGAITEAVPLWARAGQRAAFNAAHVEAVAHLQTALDLLRRQPADGVRIGLELQLLIGLAVSISASRGYCVPEVGQVLAEAREICDALGNVAELFAILRNICSFSIVACDLDTAEETARRCVEIGEQTGLAEHRIEADYAFGYVMSLKGHFSVARLHLERVARLYAEHDGVQLAFPSPQDPLTGGLCALLFALYAMGDKPGVERAAHELAAHVRSIGRTFDIVYSLSFQAGFEIVREDYAGAEKLADQAIDLCEQHGYSTWGMHAKLYKAIALGNLGKLDQGLAMAHSGIAESDRLANMAARGFYLGEIAGLQAKAGDTLTALRTIDAAIATTLRYGDHYVLSPLHRRRAEILAAIPGTDAAEVSAALREAIAIADAQGAAGFARQAAALLPRESVV